MPPPPVPEGGAGVGSMGVIEESKNPQADDDDDSVASDSSESDVDDLDEDSGEEKGGDGEEPETTDLFKKWMKENLPGDLQTPEEMNKKEAAHLAAVRPTTKEQDTAAMKAIRV